MATLAWPCSVVLGRTCPRRAWAWHPSLRAPYSYRATWWGKCAPPYVALLLSEQVVKDRPGLGLGEWRMPIRWFPSPAGGDASDTNSPWLAGPTRDVLIVCVPVHPRFPGRPSRRPPSCGLAKCEGRGIFGDRSEVGFRDRSGARLSVLHGCAAYRSAFWLSTSARTIRRRVDK